MQLKADAYNYAYMDLAPTYRDKLGLPSPTEYYKNLGLTPPGATPVTPTQTSPIINPPKVNPTMPTVPQAQFHWDPVKMQMVPG